MAIPKRQAYRGKVKTITLPPEPTSVIFRDNPFLRKTVKENADLKTRIKALTAEIERLKAEVLAGDERECLLTQEILQKGEK